MTYGQVIELRGVEAYQNIGRTLGTLEPPPPPPPPPRSADEVGHADTKLSVLGSVSSPYIIISHIISRHSSHLSKPECSLHDLIRSPEGGSLLIAAPLADSPDATRHHHRTKRDGEHLSDRRTDHPRTARAGESYLPGEASLHIRLRTGLS